MEKPDWVLWGDAYRSVTLEECVCLSLNSEPHQKPASVLAPVLYVEPARNPNDEPRAAPVVLHFGDRLTKQQQNERLALTHKALLTPEGQERLKKLRWHFDEGSSRLPPAGQRGYYGYEEKRVMLLDFARWAYAMKWSVPEPLDLTPTPALASPVVLEIEANAPPVVPAGASGGVETATSKKWTSEKLAQLESYREQHGTKKAAEFFGISEQLVRRKLPSEKPQPQGYSAFTHRAK